MSEIITNYQKEDEYNVSFEINNNNEIHVAMFNAIRRVIIGELPAITIDKDTVEFGKNTSCIQDNDQLSIRLGSILFYDDDSIPFDNIMLELKYNNNKYTKETVYLKDFNIIPVNDTFLLPKAYKMSDITPFEDIQITHVKYNKEISCTCKFVKKSPQYGGGTFSQSLPPQYRFKISETRVKERIKELREEGKIKDDFDEESYRLLEAKHECVERLENDEPATVHMIIECEPTTTSDRVFTETMEILYQKLDMIKSAFINNDHEKLTVKPAKREFFAWDVVFTDESDTLGNLLSTYLCKYYPDEYNTTNAFCGYKKPHPSRNDIILRLSSASDFTNITAEEFDEKESWNNNLKNIIGTIDQLKELCHKIKDSYVESSSA
jgi:DNA-directed RNA polymerase subunit L